MTSPERTGNAQGASSVPRGIKGSELKGYPRLERNQYGAINVALYSAEQWKASGLPYCKYCMTHAGQAAWFRREPWWDGFGWSYEPCPHGHIVTAERVAQQVQAKKQRDLLWVAVYAVLTAVSFGGLGLWGGIGILLGGLIAILAFRSYRKTAYKAIRILNEHPEIDGFWEKNKSENQPWR